jgi:nitroreductase
MNTKIKNTLKLMYRVSLAFSYFFYDAKRYFYSVLNPFSNQHEVNEGAIIKRIHSIEKRISFGGNDKKHGRTKAYGLLSIIKTLKDKNTNVNSYPYNWALSTLYQFANHFFTGDEKKTFIEQLRTINKEIEYNNFPGGVFSKHRNEIFKASQEKFDNFSKNRHSIRWFEKAADIELIEKSVSLAQKCPSTCSIQPVKTYLIQDSEKILKVLEIQRGNRGFTEKIPQLIIITANQKLYSGLRERNQSYVDGGIFALSFIYSLHFHKIGSCILNWAASKNEDLQLRKILDIPKNEAIVLIIAVGKIPENNIIPTSIRRPTETVFKII